MTVHHREVGSHIHVHLYAGEDAGEVSSFAGFLVLSGPEWEALREALESSARTEGSALELSLVQDLAGDQLPEWVSARPGPASVVGNDAAISEVIAAVAEEQTMVDGVQVVVAEGSEVSQVP